MKKIVHLVHCLDTEGPLYESIEATFERLKASFGIDIAPSRANLKKLQRSEIKLNGLEGAVAKMLNPDILDYKPDWPSIYSVLDDAMSDEFRNELKDSFGDGWVFNWFCVDHIDYKINPRQRDIGYANVFDRYLSLKNHGNFRRDGLHFHFHPMSFDRAAHHCGTHYFAHSDSLFRILAYRVINRQWFPNSYRPGFNTIRPDSHWFLEQFVPFDFSNQGFSGVNDQPDLVDGRFGDWRRATTSWTPYHPDHDDHESAGNCRRYIARCLNVGTRFKLLDMETLETAFKEASEGKPVVVGFADHDYRDIRKGVRTVRQLLPELSKKYPDVQFKFCEAREAMRSALSLPAAEPVKLELELKGNTLRILAGKKIFGPQPYLAFMTADGNYIHDNVDIHKPFHHWSYTFDEHSIPLDCIRKIGVAVNDDVGNTTVANLDLGNGEIKHKTW